MELIVTYSGKTFFRTKDSYQYLDKEIKNLLAEQRKELKEKAKKLKVSRYITLESNQEAIEFISREEVLNILKPQRQ